LLAVKKDQGNGGRILRVNGEADPARQDRRPFPGKARADFETSHFIEWTEVVAEAADIAFIIDKVR